MTSFFFTLNITSCACLLGSGLKLIFYWKGQLLINFKSFLTSFAEILTSWDTQNKEVSSLNNLHSLLRPFDKSLTYIKIKRGPRMEPCGSPVQISTPDEHWPFKITLCFLLVKKSFSILTIYRFDAVCKSFQHAKLYQRLLRYQRITLQLQNLYRKHLKYHNWWRAVN